MAQWGLSNPSTAPYCKILWEAHFSITTNCVKQWGQLIGRKLLSEPSDTFDCILSTLQLLSSEPISEGRKYELICKRTMAQSIKTAGSCARSFSSWTQSQSPSSSSCYKSESRLCFLISPCSLSRQSDWRPQSLLTARAAQGWNRWDFSLERLLITAKSLFVRGHTVSWSGRKARAGRAKSTERSGLLWVMCDVVIRGDLMRQMTSWCKCRQSFGEKKHLKFALFLPTFTENKQTPKLNVTWCGSLLITVCYEHKKIQPRTFYIIAVIPLII